jgi:hypothetical protein
MAVESESEYSNTETLKLSTFLFIDGLGIIAENDGTLQKNWA